MFERAKFIVLSVFATGSLLMIYNLFKRVKHLETDNIQLGIYISELSRHLEAIENPDSYECTYENSN